jgi:FKBP-type peptidyl-prolyl cis-trans isomerase 2
MVVEKGDKVQIEYTGTLDNGNVFDTSEKHGKPLEFEVGSGDVIPGFDSAVMGMEEGEEKDITIEPKDAYGVRNGDLVKKIPRSNLPQDQVPKVGMVLAVGFPDGRQLPAKIIEVDDVDVSVDMNHPLAERTLHFKIKLVGLTKATSS